MRAGDQALFEAADNSGSWRLHILLQADDQAIPAGSLTALAKAIAVAESWSIVVHQAYHVSPDKTVILLIGIALPATGTVQAPEIYGQKLTFTGEHKWLGVIWDTGLTFEPNFLLRTAAARAAFKPVLALVRDGLASLGEAHVLQSSKVQGALFFAPVFLFLAEDSRMRLDALQEEFARELLAGDKWGLRPAALRAEMGAALTWGEESALRVVCMRAELWTLPDGLTVKRTVGTCLWRTPARTWPAGNLGHAGVDPGGHKGGGSPPGIQGTRARGAGSA